MPRPKKCKEYSEKKRIQILLFNAKRYSVRKIAKKVKATASGVSAFLRRVAKRMSIQDLPRSGQPRKIPDRAVREVKLALKRGQLHDTQDIQKFLHLLEGIDVGRTCVQELMKKEGYRAFKLQRKPLLSRLHKKKRLKIAREWSREDKSFWRSVVFTDETSINRVSTGNKHFVYLPKGYPFTELRMQPTASHGGGSLSLWAAITVHGILAWAIFEGDLTSAKYVKIVKTRLLKKAQEVFGEADWILQQDGDPAHTANATIDQLESLGESHGFSILPWPPHSPDLNLIENLWATIKDLLSKEGPARNMDELAERLAEKIDILNAPANKFYFENLYDSMPARLHQIIVNHGASTKF